MTRLLISTTCRNKPFDQASGYLYVFDLDAQQILRRSKIIEPPYRVEDTNPRGGIRGYKGIAIRDNCVAVGNSSCTYLYNPKWELLGKVSHPSCAGIHDIAFDGDGLWITSSRNDMIYNFDFSGQVKRFINFRKSSALLEDIRWQPKNRFANLDILEGELDFRRPNTHDLDDWDQAHVNSVAVLPDGRILVSTGLLVNQRLSKLLLYKKWLKQYGLWERILKLNRQLRSVLSLKKDVHTDLIVKPVTGHSALFIINQDGTIKRLLLLSNVSVPAHSVRVLEDGSLIYLNTTDGCLLHLQLNDGQVMSSTKIGEKFLRGAVQLEDSNLVLGDGQDIMCFDLQQRNVLNRFRLSVDPDESVFDVKVLGRHFDLPPLSFVEHPGSELLNGDNLNSAR